MVSERKIFYLSILVLVLLNTSFRWPLDEGRLTSSFGESRWDHFHDGIDIISSDNKIRTVADGRLVYCFDRSIFPTDKYPGGGNYRILEHQGGIYSLYLHMSDGFKKNENYKEGEVIGAVGNTGHSMGNHLHLSFLKISDRTSINPLEMFPKIDDKKEPVIGEAFVRILDRYTVIKENSRVRLTRHYPLLIDIHDSYIGSESLGIAHLSVEFNGRKIFDNSYNSIAFTKNGLTISGMTHEDLFDSKGYYKVKNIRYRDGVNLLKITAADYSGNKSEKEISFEVKLDIQ